ncbi:hypothetical protein K491DRAFT_691666 [Lophiostoma macrostomum CBS 122681]|uniref:SPX domain-containing protein n=1 Tax=Lophiostoma macrostomum CBS 122681 TaxID=1314788 RepID=A0A6A6TA07_9PLEO|nr:hypothetical protein K491DRAFT_691666 [Lophiostoma macrostomum CBS 122681]
MKYGDTLRQRSIPEWGHYNIDYDYLKDLIKHNTTPGNGKALSIPGQGASIDRAAFGDTFFDVLKSQHDRINLFIKSKSGEIERRLEYIGKQLAHLQARRAAAAPGEGFPARLVEKYAKIDADVTKAGEEIRSLSRFQIAQRTGFQKILKKYKRWTNDREVVQRFKEDVIRQPDSFFQLDLGYLLDQYIDVLGAVRAPLESTRIASPLGEPSEQSSTSRLTKAIEHGSGIDFDVALSTVPLGSHGSRASYWVHTDHIVEVEVLLLQHMRLYVNNGTNPVSRDDSPYATPNRRKSSATVDQYLGNEDDAGMIVLDQEDSFAKKQNTNTIGSSEEVSGTLLARGAGNARWASGEGVVTVGLDTISQDRNTDAILTARLKRKHVATLLDSTTLPDSNGGLSNESPAESVDSASGDVTAVRQWLHEHNGTRPLAGFGSKRTRFVGLHNTLTGGMWASLDRDIFMKQDLQKDLGSSEWLSDSKTGSTSFPHTVLHIRREGHQSPVLIQLLDRSHLLERVRGFSLETHAVWECSKPSSMSQPIWVPLLQGDIRKLPAPLKRRRRKADSTNGSSVQISPPQTSTSATSAASPYRETSATSASEFVDPPPLRAFRKKSRRPFAEHAESTHPDGPPEQQRYWNEYDHPEDEEEGYYIYMDPDATVKYPGQEFLEAISRKARGLFGMTRIDKEDSPPSTSADYESSDEETADENPSGVRNGYGTIATNPFQETKSEGYFSNLFNAFRSPQREVQSLRHESERRSLLHEIHVRQHEREMAKLQVYSSCLGAGAILDITLCILTMTTRRKLRGEADLAIIIGVICNLLLLLVAVTSMRTRMERLGWVHQGSVFVSALAMMVIDAWLFRWALNL